MLVVAGLAVVLTHLSLGVSAQDDPVEQGRLLAQNGTMGAAPCANCHGADGNGTPAAGFPRLAGVPQGYLERQLLDYQAGTRSKPVMETMAKALSREQVAAVAAYYASLNPGSPGEQGAAEQKETAERLAIYGDWNRDIPSCVSCHGAGGRGIGDAFPPIAAQPASYISAQLTAWKSGERKNDPNNLMKVVADRLEPAEIEALAVYFSSLPSEAGGSQ